MNALAPLSVEHAGSMWSLWKQAGQQEPMAKDLDVATWLEFSRPRDIRPLLKRYAKDLGVVFRGTVPRNSGAGRPEECWFLTEEQALFLAAKSETPKSTQVLKAMISVFRLARRAQDPAHLLTGLLGQSAPVDLSGIEERLSRIEKLLTPAFAEPHVSDKQIAKLLGWTLVRWRKTSRDDEGLMRIGIPSGQRRLRWTWRLSEVEAYLRRKGHN